MTNRILHVELTDRSVIPTEAEVQVLVYPELLDAETQVRGRLMGPRCHFANTVEVAYHLRLWPVPTARPAISLRAVIPEASLWEPETPHLYSGPIELWQGIECCETVEVRHGLRYLSVGPRGLRVNGRSLRLRGRMVETLDEPTALELRRDGYNLLVTPVHDSSRPVWEMADRIGFLVLGRIEARGDAGLLRTLASHPSCLGWLSAGGAALLDGPPRVLHGVETSGAAPPGASFVALPATELPTTPSRTETPRPMLLLDVGPGRSDVLFGRGAEVIGVVER